MSHTTFQGTNSTTTTRVVIRLGNKPPTYTSVGGSATTSTSTTTATSSATATVVAEKTSSESAHKVYVHPYSSTLSLFEILCNAINQGDSKIVCNIIVNTSRSGTLPLLIASVDKHNRGAFIVASKAPHISGDYKYLCILDKLKHSGFDTNTPDEFGRNALHYAVKKGDVEVVKFFLKTDISVSQQDIHGNTPLHLAYSYGIVPVIRELIRAHCDLEIKNNKNKTPYEMNPFISHNDVFDYYTLKKLEDSYIDTSKYKPQNTPQYEDLVTAIPSFCLTKTKPVDYENDLYSSMNYVFGV